jgi:GNAT superfamily N-acetyltransferase
MTNDQFHLRAATADDAATIATLLSELGYQARPADIPQRLAAVAREGGTVLLAIDDDSTALGLMCLARHSAIHSPGPFAYITALVTTFAARRRGVGRVFVECARDWAAENGCVRITVTSAEHRTDAHAFYPAVGMPYTGRRFSAMIDENA